MRTSWRYYDDGVGFDDERSRSMARVDDAVVVEVVGVGVGVGDDERLMMVHYSILRTSIHSKWWAVSHLSRKRQQQLQRRQLH